MTTTARAASIWTPAKRSSTLAQFAMLMLATGALASCKHLDDPVQPTSFTLVDPSERHPIIVSQQPKDMTVSVARGSSGLTPVQRAQLAEFLRRYRASDAGNSKLVIQVPRGSSNELASVNAIGEIRQLVSEQGFEDSMVGIESYPAARGAQPPIRVSYLRFVAEAPECGRWPSNLAREPYNLPYPNLGCANQRNFAAMVANPADLVGARTMTPGSSERRSVTWTKYTQGETTGARKGDEEKVKTDTKN